MILKTLFRNAVQHTSSGGSPIGAAELQHPQKIETCSGSNLNFFFSMKCLKLNTMFEKKLKNNWKHCFGSVQRALPKFFLALMFLL